MGKLYWIVAISIATGILLKAINVILTELAKSIEIVMEIRKLLRKGKRKKGVRRKSR